MLRTPTLARVDGARRKMASCLDSAIRRALTMAVRQGQNTAQKMGRVFAHTLDGEVSKLGLRRVQLKPTESFVNKGIKANVINTGYKGKKVLRNKQRSWESKHSIRTVSYGKTQDYLG